MVQKNKEKIKLRSHKAKHILNRNTWQWRIDDPNNNNDNNTNKKTAHTDKDDSQMNARPRRRMKSQTQNTTQPPRLASTSVMHRRSALRLQAATESIPPPTLETKVTTRAQGDRFTDACIRTGLQSQSPQSLVRIESILKQA